MVNTKNYKSESINKFNVGIIGFGPKGLFAFERLLAQIKERDIKTPITIYLFNQNHFFGAGNVYRNDQPSYLIMNYANRNIDIWPKESSQSIIDDTLNFSEWLAEKTETPIEEIVDGVAPRALVGNYLMESFGLLRENAPSNVRIIPQVATVQKIAKKDGRYKLYATNDTIDSSIEFDRLMLTTGHFGSGAQFDIENPSSNYIEFIYPVSKKLKHIKNDTAVAIRGFGLTAIDAILALTEGRGGTFASNDNGQLCYTASGKGPHKIYLFSRTGLPMFPRSMEDEDKSQLYFFTEDAVKGLQSKPYCNFREEVLPLIIKEFTLNYYKVLFKKHRRQLHFDRDYHKIDEQIEQFHIDFPQEKRFQWDALLNPFLNQEVLSHDDVKSYIKSLIYEAKIGFEDSPIMAAAGTWRKISPVFNKLYSFAGLDANSHRLFDIFYFGFFNRIAYGPPVINMKKILALAEADIVDFNFVRSPRVSKYEGDHKTTFALYNGREKIPVHYLINARIPRNEMRIENSVQTNLLTDGLIYEYVNSNNGSYKPGCAAIDYKGRPYTSDGQLQKNITMYGTPTEGVVFDNDTLSRKRNNFASQWAQDIAEILEKQQNSSKLKNEEKDKIQ